MSEYYLEIHGVSKAFQAVQALDNVELRLRPGEIKCLAGENGCGKSTLIKIISGVYTPDSGEIIIKGKKYTSLTPRESIAPVFRSFTRISHCSPTSPSQRTLPWSTTSITGTRR